MKKIERVKLVHIITLSLVIVFLLGAILNIYIVNQSLNRLALTEAESKAKILVDHNLAIHAYFAEIMRPRLFQRSAPYRGKEYFEPSWMSSSYAIREIHKYFSKLNRSGYYIKDAAINARNPENEADGLERAFLEKLKDHHEIESEAGIRMIDGKTYFTLLKKGEVMEKTCLTCHGNPSDAPKQLTQLYGAERGFHEKEGNLVSAISLRIPLSDAYAVVRKTTVCLSVLLAAGLAILLVIQFMLYRRLFIAPLTIVRDKALEIAGTENHLGEKISGLPGKEWSELADVFNEMSVKLKNGRDRLEDQVRERTHELITANEQLREEISERKKIEQILVEEEILCRMLFESTIDVVYSIDKDLRVLSISPSVERALGYRCDEVVGAYAYDLKFIPPESLEKGLSEISRILKGETITASNYLFVARDGTPRMAEVSGAPLLRRGEIVGVICVARDRTEQHLAEEEQRRNRETAERLAKEMAIIAEIGRLISSTLDINEVYERFAAKVQKLIPFDRLSVNLHDLNQGVVRVAFLSGEKVPGRNQGDSFPLKGSVSEVLVWTRMGMFSHPSSVEEMNKRFPDHVATIQAGMRSLLSVPLIFRDDVIGSLHFRSKKPLVYNEQDLRLAERIGAQIAGAIANARLFTELKEVDKSLRESEGQFRALFEQAAVGVAEIDINTGRFLTVNRRLCEMVGRTEEEMLAATFEAITHPEDLHLHVGKTAQLLAGEIEYYSLEKRYLRKDGGVVWMEITVSPLWKLGETPGRNIAVYQDITERKRIDEENERRSKQMAALHAIGIELTAELNLEALLQSIAQHALNLIGGKSCNCFIYRPELDLMELVTTAGADLAHSGKMRRRGEGAVGQVWATGAPLLIHDYHTWQDRKREYDHLPSRTLVLVPVRWGEEFLGVLSMLAYTPHRYIEADMDMLSMFAAQAAIAIHNARLYDKMRRDLEERRRLEGERKAMQAQLLQSQKMEAIGTLAGGIAHDFNNILMGIQGYLTLIQMDLPSDHPHYFRLHGIEEQIGSGASLTKQLLGFAREGKYDVKPTNLNVVLQNSYEIFAPTHKEISVSRSLQEGLWPVDVDRKQIEQVLLNLFINSGQAMPEGGDLYLETQNVVLSDLDVKPYGVQPGRYVKISVTDTGTGMDESTRARIFEPFFTTKKPGKGTGLGLASVYGIMNNHGGFITVQSELGKGATFTPYLPASQKEVIVEEKPVEKKVLAGSETILVVDDEKSNATVMREILESLGYRVLIAGSGQEAVAVYMEKGKEVDLVLLDMIMPGMGGGRTFDALRSINPGVKVILCSGYSADGEARQILDRGCNGFIQKPFRIANITGMIREVIEK